MQLKWEQVTVGEYINGLLFLILKGLGKTEKLQKPISLGMGGVRETAFQGDTKS